MTIVKEGQILIQPDGTVIGTGFHVDGGTLQELQAEVERRVKLAASRLSESHAS